MSITMIQFKDFNEKYRKKIKEDWDKDSKNYDEEIEENQLIMIDVDMVKEMTNSSTFPEEKEHNRN